jgi:hypothetical protein
MDKAAAFLQAKLDSGELDSGYLADGLRTLLAMAAGPNPDDHARWALENPFHWLVGFYGYATEFFAQEG